MANIKIRVFHTGEVCVAVEIREKDQQVIAQRQ